MPPPLAFARRNLTRLRPARMARSAIALALAATCLVRAEEVWIGSSDSRWSDDAKWLDGSAPPAGGDADLALRFDVDRFLTATNDLGNPFLLRSLELNSSFHLFVAGSRLRFEGAASILASGRGEAELNAPVELATDLTVGGTWQRSLLIGSTITETGAARRIIIDAAAPRFSSQVVTLRGRPCCL